MLETLIVAIIVTASVLFSAWQLMPGRQRLRLVQWLGEHSLFKRSGWLTRLERTTRSQLGGSCDDCSLNAHAGAARHRKPGALRR